MVASVGGEVCKNIICLGLYRFPNLIDEFSGRLAVTTVQGITIASCNYTLASSVKSSDPEISQFLSRYDSQKSFSGVDILLTNDWPRGLLHGLAYVSQWTYLTLEGKNSALKLACRC